MHADVALTRGGEVASVTASPLTHVVTIVYFIYISKFYLIEFI